MNADRLLRIGSSSDPKTLSSCEIFLARFWHDKLTKIKAAAEESVRVGKRPPSDS